MNRLGFVKYNDMYVNPFQIDYVTVQDEKLFSTSGKNEVIIVSNGEVAINIPEDKINVKEVISKIQKSAQTGETIDLMA